MYMYVYPYIYSRYTVQNQVCNKLYLSGYGAISLTIALMIVRNPGSKYTSTSCGVQIQFRNNTSSKTSIIYHCSKFYSWKFWKWYYITKLGSVKVWFLQLAKEGTRLPLTPVRYRNASALSNSPSRNKFLSLTHTCTQWVANSWNKGVRNKRYKLLLLLLASKL